MVALARGMEGLRESLVRYVLAVVLNLAAVWALPVGARSRARRPLPIERLHAPGSAVGVGEVLVPYPVVAGLPVGVVERWLGEGARRRVEREEAAAPGLSLAALRRQTGAFSGRSIRVSAN